jgi:low temperature requirement protein LtrA
MALRRRALATRVYLAYHRFMWRKVAPKYEPQIVDGFRLRGREVTRLESFADAVFGFALTLLVVSLDVPKNFDDLVKTMRGFPAFAVCFLLLILIWNSHYRFCRRYGLDDGMTRFLTCVLLFFVLFYVYPLKFLFNLSDNLVLRVGPSKAADVVHVTVPQLSFLLLIYGLGFGAVYLAILLLYLHAYRLREALDLSDLERLDTRYHLGRIATLSAVGFLGAGLAQIRWFHEWGGLVYLALFPIGRVIAVLHQRKRAPLLAAAAGL